MRTITISILLLLHGVFTKAPATAQSAEIQQLVLNYQKLAQLKNLLQQMYKGYQVVSAGYNKVKDISEGNFNLHDAYLSALLNVSPAVRNYSRVAAIISDQAQLLREVQAAKKAVQAGQQFSNTERGYLGRVYGKLISGSLDNLDDLIMVLTAGKMRMNDEERLRVIDRIYEDTHDKLGFLRHFNRTAQLRSLQQQRALQNIEQMKTIHHLK